MKFPFLISFLWLMGQLSIASAQYFPRDKATTPAELTDAIQTLQRSKTSGERLKALLNLSSCYLFKPGEAKTDLDSAFLFALKARQLSRVLKIAADHDEATKLAVGTLYERKDHLGMLAELDKLSGTAKFKTLTYWGDHYFYISYGYRPMKLIYLDTAWVFYKRKLLVSKALKDEKFIKDAIGHLEHLIRICSEQKDRNRVKQQSQWLEAHTRSLHIPFPSVLLSAMLAEQEVIRGDYGLALERSLYALKRLNDRSTSEEKFWTYGQVGQIYRFTGKYDKSNIYYLKLIDMADEFPAVSIYTSAYFVCNNYRQLKQIDRAVTFITDLQKRFKPKTRQDEVYLSRTLAENFTATKQHDLALKNWLQAKHIMEKGGQSTTAINLYIGAIYSDMGKYNEADKAYEQCEKASQELHVRFLASLFYQRSQVKAKLGDYQAALIYLNKNKRITDSLFTLSKEKHTQELDIQYETQKKELQLKQRADSIRFLNQRNILQQENAQLQGVKLLQAQQLAQRNKAIISLKQRDLDLKSKDYRSVSQIASLQRSQLKQAVLNKKITMAVIALLVVIIALILFQFRQNKRNSLTISEKNRQLNSLVDEKEWLLKEVHHRVKNNLQTIVNLLESQSDHLEEPALTAIETSKNRIFAMSLIHHKLYLAEESSKIDMRVYISELVSFLRETFYGRPVLCHIDTDPIKLSIGRAIPIGLIINEAVTNSLKHAFYDQENRKIDITFKMGDNGTATLMIADNGKGLSRSQLVDEPKTMGLKLIRGLTRQLDADLQLLPDNGTKFIISSIYLNDMTGAG